MKKTIVLALCLIFSQNARPKGIIQISIPKCGTYLLKKCIDLLGVLPNMRFNAVGASIKPALFGRGMQKLYGHIRFKEEYLPFLTGNTAIFLIYRDPRDQVVSGAYHILKHSYNHLHVFAHSISFDDLLSFLIEGGQGWHNTTREAIHRENVSDYYQLFLPWLSAPHVCGVRFEDLIGLHGGGDAGRQYETIKNIADHVGMNVSQGRIDLVVKNLFGGTETFRKGLIGDWKNHFKEHHKQAFKKVAGQLLIDLGYEKDFDW